eukprot:m51a1_g9836 putative isovaleryl-CoA dehydrogenase (420) ;mRNA; r:1936004-1937585
MALSLRGARVHTAATAPAAPAPAPPATASTFRLPNRMALLDPDQKQLLESVAKFAETEIAPLAQRLDRENEAPHEIWRAMGSQGLLGITVPPEYGGLGLGYFEHCLVMEEISRACGAIGLSYGAHSNLCVDQIRRHGTDAQKARFLPKLVSGEWVGALAMTEPDAGSDATSMRTVAEPDGAGGYVLRGTKTFITNAGRADVYVLYAKTQPELGHRGMTCFVVRADSAGLSVGPRFDKMGMRGSDTREVVLDGVRVGADCVLGGLNKGVYVMMSGLDSERLVLSGGPLGIMGAAVDLSVAYAAQRRQFGQRVGAFELMQGKLADMWAALGASRAHVYATARAKDAGAATSADCAAAIMQASERATQVALQAVQTLGGNGYINDYAPSRLVRDAKLYEIGAGTNEIRRMLIGRELMRALSD